MTRDKWLEIIDHAVETLSLRPHHNGVARNTAELIMRTAERIARAREVGTVVARIHDRTVARVLRTEEDLRTSMRCVNWLDRSD